MANANASKVKMKNHSMILLFLLLLTIFSSCSKTEKTLSDIPADRDSELLTNCKTDRKLAKMMAMPTKALNQSINQSISSFKTQQVFGRKTVFCRSSYQISSC